MQAFTEIQNYAIFRQEYITNQLFEELQNAHGQEEESGLYTLSIRLPKELFQMEVLYNLGRAFHQVDVVRCNHL